ncbi:hypothetical protein [Noviherbaspirillum sp.]|uniref:hypothetical protein n=1 Tax=Noviherbaspirillum sp. TaxID=1926288 RepID=UPI0039C9FB25
MSMQSMRSANQVLANLNNLLPDLEALYTDIHAHPELSMQETRTASLAADRLRAAGYEVTTGVGKTGVVGLLRNGAGPTSASEDFGSFGAEWLGSAYPGCSRRRIRRQCRYAWGGTQERRN